MFKLNRISAKYFDYFRTQFGIYAAVLIGLLLGDKSLGPVFGHSIYLASLIGIISALFWSLNYKRRIAAVVYILCLMFVVETNQSALRVIPGYVGWIFFTSLFIPTSEGSFLRNIKPESNWSMPFDIHLMLIITLGFSFTFSGLTKFFSELWLQGRAIDHFLFNVRFNWNFKSLMTLNSVITTGLNYMTMLIELLFLPLYLWSPTRKFAWHSLFFLFTGILFFMRIYVVSIGILSLLFILYVPANERFQSHE